MQAHFFSRIFPQNLVARAGQQTPNTQYKVLFLACLMAVTPGCAMFSNPDKNVEPFIEKGLNIAPEHAEQKRARLNQNAVKTDEAEINPHRETGFFQTPQRPVGTRGAAGNPPPSSQPPGPKEMVNSSVALENMSIPQFITAVYSVILKRNVSVDPAILQRTDLVSLRTGKPQTHDQLAAAAQAVLRSYGVAVTEFQGLVRVVPENDQAGYLPEIKRGRAQPDIPAALRPIFYLVELEHTSIASVSNWIKTIFKARLTVVDDPQRNALLLSGQSDIVAAAMETIQLLDQPLMRGKQSVRIAPVFWAADEMAKRLNEMLTAEGYLVAASPSSQAPILILPVAPANSVIVFAADEAVLNHILDWARELDQSPKGRSNGYITYHVRNTDATELAKTLQEVMGGASSGPSPSTSPTGAPGGVGAAPAGGGAAVMGKKVVVNASANSIIIQTNAAEYQQWYGLLQELDRPARAALIMTTVAEVRLTDTETTSFNWLLKQFTVAGGKINLGLSGGLNGTLNTAAVQPLNGDATATLNLLASNNRSKVLSNPSLMVLSGQSASMQIGQDVPIITSQVTNANTNTSEGSQGTLQTVQYRSTGTILKIKPVIHAGGRIDLEVSQEVSSAIQASEGGVQSPTISQRRLDTKMSVLDGQTMLLAGMISENSGLGNSGIPYLKDIPLLGALFREKANKSIDRTELVVLITPYVIEDDFDARAVTDAFRSQFKWATPMPVMKPINTDQNNVQNNQQNPVDVPVESPLAPVLPNANIDQRSAAPNDNLAPIQEPIDTLKTPEKEINKYQSKPYIVPPPGVPAPNSAPEIEEIKSNYAPAAAPATTNPAARESAQNPTQKRQNPATEQSPAAAPKLPNQGGALPPNMKPVTDEKLKQELLNSLKGG